MKHTSRYLLLTLLLVFSLALGACAPAAIDKSAEIVNFVILDQTMILEKTETFGGRKLVQISCSDNTAFQIME